MDLKKINIKFYCCILMFIMSVSYVCASRISRDNGASNDKNYIDDRYINLYKYIGLNKKSPIDLFRDAFTKYNIVVVGETHDKYYREFIIKNIKSLNSFVDYFGAEIDIEYGDGHEYVLNYDKYLADAPKARIENGELAMLKAAIDAGLKVVCLRGDNEMETKNNITKYKNKKILIWYGAHHVSLYDRGLGDIPLFRRIINDNDMPLAYNILLLTMFNSNSLGNAVLYYSNFKNKTFALADLNKIPENLYNYNMDLKEIFMNFDAFIYYVPEKFHIVK